MKRATIRKPKPACRVCGCTYDRACDGGCWWAKVEGGSAPLCSACSGTADDMTEVLIRIKSVIGDDRKSERPRITSWIRAAINRRADRIRDAEIVR